MLALFVQLIDQFIVAVAAAQGSTKARKTILAERLPGEWFTTVYPAGSRRSVDRDLHLWRGKKLIRVDAHEATESV